MQPFVQPSSRVGLVLGAGGLTGYAFHAGALAALSESTGWDPRTARVIVGTSAGSQVAALLRAGMPAADLFARTVGEQLSSEGTEVVARMGGPWRELADGQGARRWRMAAPGAVARALVRPWALRPGPVLSAMVPKGVIPTDEISGPFLALWGDRWPAMPLWVCALDVGRSRRVVFGRDALPTSPPVGVAVAASCAIPGYYAPVPVDGREYIDGGAYSHTNLDVVTALDLDLVVVLAPMAVERASLTARRVDTPARAFFRRQLATEARRVRRQGAAVVAFQPTANDLGVMGFDALDPRRRADVARQIRRSTLQRLEHGGTRERISLLAPEG